MVSPCARTRLSAAAARPTQLPLCPTAQQEALRFTAEIALLCERHCGALQDFTGGPSTGWGAAGSRSWEARLGSCGQRLLGSQAKCCWAASLGCCGQRLACTDTACFGAPA